MPRPHQQELIKRSAVEAAESPRRLCTELAFGRRTGFEAVSQPLIGSRRDYNAVEIEGRVEAFALGDDVEFEAVAALEPPVYRRREHVVAFPASVQIGDQRRLELGKRLAEPPVMRTWRVVDPHVVAVDAGPGHEAEWGLKRVADSRCAKPERPEIVGILDTRGCRRVISDRSSPIHRLGRDAGAEVLVASEMRRLIREVGSRQPAVFAAGRIAGRADETD